MDALRLSLIIIGVLIIAVVWWWSRRVPENDKTISAQPLNSRLEPDINQQLFSSNTQTVANDLAHASIQPELVAEQDLNSFGQFIPDNPPLAETHPPKAADVFYATTSGEQLIITLAVLSPAGRMITGEAIMQAAKELNLEFGDKRIFHHVINTVEGTRQVVASVANILEPGVFDLEKMRTFHTPGLAVFMRLPGPMEARAAFDVLIELGNQLATKLGAELCDESRSALTQQTIGYLKEKVEAYRFKQKLTAMGLGGATNSHKHPAK